MIWVGGNLISVSTKSEGYSSRDIDASRFTGLPIASHNEYNKKDFTQELRFSSQFDGPFQFLGGFYYENLELTGYPTLAVWSGDDALDIFGGATLLDETNETHIQQKALFGEVSYDF